MTADEVGSALEGVQAKLYKGTTGAEEQKAVERYLGLARALGEPTITAKALLLAAGYFLLDNQRGLARGYAEEGLELIRHTRSELEVDLLVVLARLLLANQVDLALALTGEAHGLSASLHGRSKPHVTLRYAEALGASGQILEAIRLMRQVEQEYDLTNDLNGRAIVLQRMCVQLVNAGHYAAVIEYASEAIQVAQELDNPLIRINALKFLATAFTKVKRLAEAYEVARKALDLASNVPKSHLNADCLGVLGDIYLDLHDLPSALTYFSQAHQQYALNGFQNGVAIALSRMAETYARAGETIQADQLFQQAEQLALEVGNRSIHRSTVIIHAAMFVRHGRHIEAEQLLNSVDVSLRTMDTDEPTDASIQHAIETFRSVTTDVRSVTLPPFSELMTSVPTLLPNTNPTPLHREKALPVQGIHVSMFGTFKVIRSGQEISMDEWKRKKARDVFKLLAANHRRSVTTDEIVQHLWGDETPVESCLPTLQNAISAIRAALEPGLKPRQASTYVTFRDGSYTLDLGIDGSTDLDHFRGLVARAYEVADPSLRRRFLTEATALYRGDFLPDDRFEPWTDYLRDTLRHTCAEAYDNLAAALFALGDEAAAKEAMRQAGALDLGE